MLQKISKTGLLIILTLICLVALFRSKWQFDVEFLHAERFLAFFALGLLFTLAYPTYWTRAVVFVGTVAFGLEGLQYVISVHAPDFTGAMEETVSSLLGICISAASTSELH